MSAGLLMLSTGSAVSGTTARTYVVSGPGVLGVDFTLSQAFLDRVDTTSTGVVAIGSGSAGDLNFSSIAGASLGATGTATRAYSGALTPAGTTYRLGGGGGTLDFQSQLTGGRALVVGGDATGLGGAVILSNAANSYTGKTTVQTGTLQFASIGNVNGGATALGNPSDATNGQIDLGSGASPVVMRYVGTGTAGHSSNRLVSLTGSSSVTFDALGAGPLAFAASGTAVTGGIGTKTLTLSGTNAGLNSVGLITGTGVSVVKDGTGLWRMTGLSRGFDGSLRVLDGTLQAAAANLGGSSQSVLLGGTSASATGRAALLLEQGVSNLAVVNVQAPAGTQAVLIGGANTSGTATYTGAFRLDRDVTLAAATGGAVDFSSAWTNAAGTGTPTRNVTIGASGGYAGRALLFANTPLTTGGTVAVQFGTAVLGNQTILSSTNTVRVASGATLGGSGVVTGAIGNGGGLVSPGNSPGILTAGSVDPTGGLGFVFEFTDTAPDYGDVSASKNDILRLTSPTAPFAGALGSSNVVNVLFALTGTASPLVSGTYTGGFFTDRNVNFYTDVFTSGSIAYWVTGTYGTVADRREFAVGQDGALVTYSRLDAYNLTLPTALTVTGTVVTTTGTFAGGEVTGQVTQFVVVPEPQALALAGIGIGLAAYALRRRRG